MNERKTYDNSDDEQAWEGSDYKDREYIYKIEKFLKLIDGPLFLKVETNAKKLTVLENLNACHDKLLKVSLNQKTERNIVSKLNELRQVIDTVLQKKHSSNFPKDENFLQPSNARLSVEQINTKEKVGCPFCFLPCQNKKDLFQHLEGNCQCLINEIVSECAGFTCFQIVLDGFKCNVCHTSLSSEEAVEEHAKSRSHFLKLKESESKSYLTYVMFCSVCHVVVADSKPQIMFHIASEIHGRLVENHMRKLMNSSVAFALLPNARLKCGLCKRNVAPSDVENHCHEPRHNQLPRNDDKIWFWCSVCDRSCDIALFEGHQSCAMHTNNMKLPLECLFCNEKCKGAAQLAQHTKIDCTILKTMRSNKISVPSTSRKAVDQQSTGKTVKPSPFKFKTAANGSV